MIAALGKFQNASAARVKEQDPSPAFELLGNKGLHRQPIQAFLLLYKVLMASGDQTRLSIRDYTTLRYLDRIFYAIIDMPFHEEQLRTLSPSADEVLLGAPVSTEPE